jgi:excisionase family DNA binding protein
MWGVAGGERLRRIRMDPSSEKLYTTAQVADMLNLSARSVRAAIKRGQMHAIAVTPRLNLVAASEVEHYRAEHLGQHGRPRKDKDE